MRVSTMILFTSVVVCLPLLGSGCDKKPSSVAPIDPSTLRTPPPASAPVQQPVLPPEAKNIPRPY